jgi:hypothetical protein
VLCQKLLLLTWYELKVRSDLNEKIIAYMRKKTKKDSRIVENCYIISPLQNKYLFSPIFADAPQTSCDKQYLLKKIDFKQQ